jgi:hypothetical protein
MSHDALLSAFISKKLKTNRSVSVSSEVGVGEIHIDKTSVTISTSYISTETDLSDLALRCQQIEWEFDTKQERDRARVVSELEGVISRRFKRLEKLDPDRAVKLLERLSNVS